MTKPDAALPFKCFRGGPRYDATILLLLLLLLLHPLASTSAFVPVSTVYAGSGVSRRIVPSRHAAARAGEVAAIEPPTTPFVQPEDLPIWPVPASLRREGPLGGPEPSYIKSLGLAEVFEAHDGPKLAELFDTDSVFRHAIRVAMRDDLFIPDPTRNEKVNRFLKDLGSSLHVSWEQSPTHYANLSRVFKEYGLQGLDGMTFIKTLGALAGGGPQCKDADGFLLHERRFGSLIDIVTAGNRLKPTHSWHQDCNLPQMTVMVGFPKSSGYKGAGVFSHAIKLTHQMKDQVPGGGAVVQYDEFEGVGQSDDLPNPLPESVILRPWYAKGREILVYDDSWHIHSAPDHIHRASLWRFM